MAHRITEVTRRDLREALSSIRWYGRLEEIDFLSRIYDLDTLPSTDRRLENARGDIVKHRLNNNDWDDDWVFVDGRFGLLNGEDEVLLHFLTEMLHPVVRTNRQDAEQLAQLVNGLLAPDGYQLVPADQISGRPVYEARFVGTTASTHVSSPAAPKHFTQDIKPLVATIARIAELDGSDVEKEVLQQAVPRLEEPEYDNWDGGTYYHTLTLLVPVDLFARLADQIRAVEDRIQKRIEAALRAPDRHCISAVVIQPDFVAPVDPRLSDVITAGAVRPVPQFWAPDRFRLFLSHVTSFKQRATALRQELLRFHITGFVAHDTIEPGELWQREIEAALRTMNAMAALITPDFHESLWTDQEIGWALGAGVYVIPVRRGANPYGFLAEVQGVQGVGKTVAQVADEVFSILVRHNATRDLLLDALVSGLERSESFAEARDNIKLIERARSIPMPLLTRIEVAAVSNDQIADSWGVPERVERLLNAHRVRPN